MKQRLGIAIALLGNPKVIILDEPINGLDPIGVIEIRNLVTDLCKMKNITFLISSHNLPELYQVAAHYFFIDNGKIVKSIGLKELGNESLEDYFLSLTGGKKMNDLIKADIYKMTKSPLIKIIFVLSILSAGLMLLFAHSISTGDIDIQNIGILSLFADSQIFTLLGCIIIGTFLCSDFEYKIIENAVSSGHSRAAVVFSKMISLIILIVFLTLPYIAAAIFLGSTSLELSVYMPTAYLTFLGPILGLNDTTKNVMEYTPFRVNYTQLASNFELINLLKPLSIGIIFLIIFTFLSVLAFRKSEIT